jgi:hypothetical protein
MRPLNLIDSKLKVSTIDQLFVATNLDVLNLEDNPERQLCRYEFFEILVRIAGAKYKDNN